MDTNLLANICESYIIDNHLYEQTTIEDLFKDFYKSMYHVRKYDPHLYENFENLPIIKKQKTVYEFFNLDYKNSDEIIQEDLISIASGVIGLVSLLYFISEDFLKTRASGKLFSKLSKIAGKLKNIGDWLSKKGRYWKFRYAVLMQQEHQMYQKCGVNKDEITGEFYKVLKNKPQSKHVLATSEKKAKCLRNQFMDNLIEQIAMLTESYFVCLKKTGNFEKVENVKPNDIISVVTKVNLSPVCSDYYKYSVESMDLFNEILDLMYEPTERQSVINKLIEKISKAKKNVQKTKNLRKYN